jgi:hypothetical protein
MSNITLYPEWFSPISPPYVPPKPVEKSLTWIDTQEQDRVDEYVAEVDEINRTRTVVRGEFEQAGVWIVKQKEIEVDNPLYKRQLAKYEECAAQFAEWEKLKAQYELERKKAAADKEYKMYLKLKAKFEKQ